MPWLDEDELTASEPLERGLVRGMDQSCAAVFLLTEHFSDAQYLQTEIDYALQARRARPGFAMIPLVLEGDQVVVPPVLQPLVYKRVRTDLDALCAILAALPVCVGTVRWREEAP